MAQYTKRPNRAALTFLLVGFFLLTLTFTARGQIDVSVVTPEREVPPNEFVSLTFSVTNESASEQQVSFDLSVPEDWSVMDEPAPRSVPAGGSTTIFLTIQVPATVKAADYSVKLTASFEEYKSSAQATVMVTEVQEVSVSAPPTQTARRDTSLSYTFTVKNTGNVTDTFDIEVDSRHDWATDYSPDALELFPGASKEVEVELYVPEDAPPGRDRLSISATPTRDSSVSASATVYTQVLPPSPQAVGGELYAVLPAQLEGSISQDLDDELPYGNLNLIADGEVGPGDLYLNFGLSEPFSDSKVDWNSLDYEGEIFTFDTGVVGLGFSESVSISGRGISGGVRLGDFELAAIDLTESPANGGVRLSYQQDDLYLSGGVANLEVDDAFIQTETLEAVYSAENGKEFELEAGYTPEGGPHGQAYRGYGQVELDPLTLEGEAFAVGPRFAGSNSGDKGFRFSQSLSGKNYSQNFNYSYVFALPTGGGLESNQLKDRLSASVRLDLLGLEEEDTEVSEAMSLRFSGSGSISHREDLSEDPDLDQDTTRINGSLFYRYENIDLSLSASNEVRTNQLSGGSYRSFELNQGFGFTYREVAFSADFSKDFAENLDSGERTSSSSSTTFLLETTGQPFVGLAVTKGDDWLNLDLDGTVNPTGNLELSLTAETYITEENIDFDGTLYFTYEYDLPLEFIVTKGRVDGTVFVDENRDDQKNEGEEGISDLVLAIEDNRVSSGEDGHFRFPPLEPGTYELEVEDLPSRFEVLGELPREVEVERGETTDTPIPLTELASVDVTVFSDENENGERDSGEGGVDQVSLQLTGQETEMERSTDGDGQARFRGLVPGTYKLALDRDTLPPRSELTTDNAEVTLELEGGDSEEILVGNYQKPRKVIYGQPPEADFAFLPGKPDPGAQVNFSGGLSEDPDGEIVEYRWDFQGDGEVDQTGMIASHVYEQEGTYEVTLTVVDDDGNEATESKEIVVQPKNQ